MTIEELSFVRVEFNQWNGFIFHFLSIELTGNNWSFEGALVGTDFSKDFMYIDFMFFRFKVFAPFN